MLCPSPLSSPFITSERGEGRRCGPAAPSTRPLVGAHTRPRVDTPPPSSLCTLQPTTSHAVFPDADDASRTRWFSSCTAALSTCDEPIYNKLSLEVNASGTHNQATTLASI